MSGLGMLGADKVFVVPTWVRKPAWVRYVQPPIPRRGQRKGTRRQWKRANPQGLRWRITPVEPDHVLHTPQGIYCTARQYADLKRRIEDRP